MARTRSTADNSAVLLIDRQDGTMSRVQSMPLDDTKDNALALAQGAKSLATPVVARLVRGGSTTRPDDERLEGRGAR